MNPIPPETIRLVREVAPHLPLNDDEALDLLNAIQQPWIVDALEAAA